MELAIISLIILVALSAFFSGSEAALLSVGRIRLQYLLKTQKKNAAVLSLSRLKSNPQKMIMAILIGNNIVNISVSFLAAYITAEMFGDLYLGLAGGITIFVLLVFGEIIPKNYATANSDRLALFVAQPLEALTAILSPLIWFFGAISRIFTPRSHASSPVFSKEELHSVLEIGVEDKAISKDEKRLVERILDINDTYVKEIMTPKNDIKTILASDTCDAALKKMAKYKKNRCPVVDSGGKAIGIISLNRALSSQPSSPVSSVMFPPFFVSKEAIAYDALQAMQKEKRQFAIVLDPAGGMDGIITIEDLVEEIVGEIDDSPFGMPTLAPAKPSIVVSGDTRLHDIEKELHISIENSQRFGSVGAFLHYQLKRIPIKGDVIICQKFRMEVEGVGSDFSLIKIKVEAL